MCQRSSILNFDVLIIHTHINFLTFFFYKNWKVLKIMFPVLMSKFELLEDKNHMCIYVYIYVCVYGSIYICMCVCVCVPSSGLAERQVLVGKEGLFCSVGQQPGEEADSCPKTNSQDSAWPGLPRPASLKEDSFGEGVKVFLSSIVCIFSSDWLMVR